MAKLTAYQFDRTYQWNYENGPDFNGDFPSLAQNPSRSLLGFSLNSPLGISAGILLNSRWISTYARLGFDILTYKTVRSAYRPCYSLPNWVFLDCEKQLTANDDRPLTARRTPRRSIDRLTSSVCFGMPSTDPKVWREDVTKAKASLAPGQVLIVSVVGTPADPPDVDALAGDYALCAKLAIEAGADMVEANLSCPNVCTIEGAIYHDRETTQSIGQRIRDALPSQIPLLLKIGILPDLSGYMDFLQGTESFADGITLVNCLQRKVHDPDGTPAFGPGKESAGVLGWATHAQCLDHTRMVLAARQQVNSKQAILSVGGVVSPEAAGDYLEAGTDAVLMGGAPVFNPYLAVEIKERYPELSG